MKIARRAVDGVLLLDKPPELSSNSAVGWTKRLFNAAKAGHTGTLDPFATGLLPICLGEAAKFARFMLDADKGYRATLCLGEKSSTGDTEGEIVLRRPVEVNLEQVSAVLAAFLGTRTQIPPMHSALKRDGVPLYKLARQGIEVMRQPRQIHIRTLTAVSLSASQLVIDTVVSKGTYIRVLAEDIGEALGCGAYLTALRRTSTGGFNIDDAVTFETLEAAAADDRDGCLLPADSLAMALPEIRLNTTQAAALKNGQEPHVEQALTADCDYRIYATDGEFIGVAHASASEDAGFALTVVRLMSTAAKLSENA